MPSSIAFFEASALVGNYRAIADQVPDQDILVMLKANAYGHGDVWAAETLLHEKRLNGIGVATLEEGKRLREALGHQRPRVRIVVFAQSAVWRDEVGAFCEHYALTPVLSTWDSLQAFWAGGWQDRVDYEIEFNTGMNRLGVPFEKLEAVRRRLTEPKSGARSRADTTSGYPAGIFSHLACAEDPKHSLNKTQLERFREITRAFASFVERGTHFHLANSAGIWNAKHFGLRDFTSVVRPGISLYGVEPWPEAPRRGLAPVMRWETTLSSSYTVKAGSTVGYGATFRARESTRVGIVGVGYADGFHRTLSAGGKSGAAGVYWVGGCAGSTRTKAKSSAGGNTGNNIEVAVRCPILGTVSMDLFAVRVPEAAREGDAVVLWGHPQQDLWSLAQAAGTIPYELFTSVSSRVQRVYR